MEFCFILHLFFITFGHQQEKIVEPYERKVWEEVLDSLFFQTWFPVCQSDLMQYEKSYQLHWKTSKGCITLFQWRSTCFWNWKDRKLLDTGQQQKKMSAGTSVLGRLKEISHDMWWFKQSVHAILHFSLSGSVVAGAVSRTIKKSPEVFSLSTKLIDHWWREHFCASLFCFWVCFRRVKL